MKPFRIIALWLAALAAVASAGAQLPGMMDSAKIVTVTSALPVSAVRPSQAITAAVVLRLPSGWHINSNRPTQDYLRATEVKLKPPKGVTLGPFTYPPAEQIKFSFDPQPLSVFEGKAVVRFPLKLSSSVKPGTLLIKGVVSYQPCNSQQCLMPVDKPFTMKVPVAKPGQKVTPANAALFGGTSPDQTASAGPSAGQGATTAEGGLAGALQHSLFLYLALIFLGGLLLNLTPCVFPMIAVTMSIFGARAGDPRAKVTGRAIVYVLGMAVMYTALGVFAALTGSLFGGLLQSVAVKLFIAAFLVLLSLGMFGVYELQPPPKLAAALGGANRSGMAGIFFSGLVVGIFAAPCTGPVVASLLLLVGQRHDVAFGAISFFTLALGLGIPYLFLAQSTTLLTKLPRSGAWLEWIKHFFGVVILTVAAYYLVLALAPDYVGLVLPVALVLGAIYLGFLDPHGRELRGFRTTRTALGVIAVVAGLYSGAAAWGSLQSRWPVYSDAALADATRAGKPVVMDFTASWCAQCRELEHETLRAPEVKRALGGFQKLRVDLDGANKGQADELQKKWHVAGLPAIVFLDSRGNEVPAARVSNRIPPSEFLTKVAAASSQTPER